MLFLDPLGPPLLNFTTSPTMPPAQQSTYTAPHVQGPPAPSPPELPAAQSQEEKELVEMIKTRQMELPPDTRLKVQNYAKKEGSRATKDLHTAVRLQGRARQDLEDALQARFNLIASWKTFLSDAIRTWQEYATLFQQQEKDAKDKSQVAQEHFNQANVQLEQSQLAAGKVKTIEIPDDAEDLAEGHLWQVRRKRSTMASKRSQISFNSCSLRQNRSRRR